MRLVAVFVLLQTTAVIDFRLREVLFLVFAVTSPYIACLALREHIHTDEQQNCYTGVTVARSTENIPFGNHLILSVEDEEINHKQQQCNQCKTLELLVIIGKYLRLNLLCSQGVQLFLDNFGRSVRVVATHIDAASCLCYLATHVFIQTAYYHIAFTVLAEVIRAGHGNRTAFRLTNTDYQHTDTRLFRPLSDSDRIVLMVLTIGYQNDGTAGITLFPETTDTRR